MPKPEGSGADRPISYADAARAGLDSSQQAPGLPAGGTASSAGAALPDAAQPAGASSEVQLDSSRLSAAFGAALGAVDDEENGAAGAAAVGAGGGRGIAVDVGAAADIPGVNAGTSGSPSVGPDVSTPVVGGLGGSVDVEAAGVGVGVDAGADVCSFLFF